MHIKKFLKPKNFILCSFLFITACIEDAPLDSLSPAGPYARTIDELFWLTRSEEHTSELQSQD